ncbi:hypothetical protein L3Y34_013760 [Caenorhabditis briggsae]|uniref:Uncharacterized protein n=1 Tax=Caenorhabditis briggsae TaxID=6238 RepID=A0AAE8ZZ82_CAEBR|nr:hypothetical protein L3Y34_013760 [Caenorhabditis briggsae]
MSIEDVTPVVIDSGSSSIKPSLVGKTSDGVPELVWKSIIKTQPDIEEALLGNICLTGGNTMLTGFKERMEHELAALIPPLVFNQISVIAKDNRKFAAFIGGSVLSSLTNRWSHWTTRQEYGESGASVVHDRSL